VNEATDGFAVLGRLQQDVGSVNVGLGEGEGVAEGVVNVCLGGEVHHGIDLLLREDVVDEVGTLDVALDELEIGQILDILQILEAGAVIELVVNDNCGRHTMKVRKWISDVVRRQGAMYHQAKGTQHQEKVTQHRGNDWWWLNLPLYCGYFLHSKMATCEAMKPEEMENNGSGKVV